jgi:hypothetical protein
MKSRLLHDGDEKTYVLAFDMGDEVVATLTEFAERHELRGSRIMGIGGFSEVTIGYFQLDKKEYKPIPIHEQVEVVSILGNISRDEQDQVVLHAHVIVGTSDGTTRGGHLINAIVRPTLELFVVESPMGLKKSTDNAIGLRLLQL